MSDLHGRITAALLREDQLRVCKLSDADIKFMADAVIRELDRDYIIVEPGTPLAQRIAQWQLSNWDGHWEGPPR